MAGFKAAGKKKRKVFLSCLLILVILVAAELLVSRYGLTVSHCSIQSKKLDGSFRAVLLSDLHNSRFGRDNSRLVKKVAAQDPDLILIAGDLINSDDPEGETAVTLIEGLSSVAPVYVSLGNHEIACEEQYGADMTELYEAAGAVVLDCTYCQVQAGGQQIRLGGIYGYCMAEIYLESGVAKQKECDFLNDFQDTEEFTLLLSHMPVGWTTYGSIEAWKPDCVLAGHAHGGQIRLPFVGGLYAPDQGWFPEHVEGIMWSEDGERSVIVTRGLGNTERIPRFGNIPEIVTIDFDSKS